ncbi:MAG TPA: serine dehydratase beta chain, partial [Lutibacter sp.]|nr:serine dehydratase beta chain [Lutibacter sp.]
MECISIFDMLKIGIGPSSSHTLGPWRAAERWINHLKKEDNFTKVTSIKVDLYGSLSLTGKGHASDLAILLGLAGEDPETIPTDEIIPITNDIQTYKKINFGGAQTIDFDPETAIIFNKEFLPFHANGIKFRAFENEMEIS